MKLRTAPSALKTMPTAFAGRLAQASAPPVERLRGRAGVARRNRILLRDRFTCQLCQRVEQPRDLRVDHITPLAMGGSDTDDGNLRALCVPCHSILTAEQFGFRKTKV